MANQFQELNYFDLARDLDFVSWDNYPDLRHCDPSQLAYNHTCVRGWKGANFWVMEEESGPPGTTLISPAPRPGDIRLWSYQAIAHGADAIVYFRWRSCHFGAEEYWHGILDHDGKPRRRFSEVRKMGRELQRVGGEIVGSEVKAEVALIFDWDSAFAFQIQPNNAAFDYIGHLKRYFAALHRRAVPVDVVPWDADLRHYKLVLAPAFYVMPAEAAARLAAYVEKGGTVLLDVRSGAKDGHNRVAEGPLPGPVAELCGVTVEEYDSLPPEVTVPLVFESPASCQEAPLGHTWCDALAPQGAKVVACYGGQHYAGRPAATSKAQGRGRAVYVGTVGNPAAYDCLFESLLRVTGVQPLLEAPAGVEVTARWQGQRRLLFVLNHTEAPQSVDLPGELRDLLSGQTLNGTVALPPKEVWILA